MSSSLILFVSQSFSCYSQPDSHIHSHTILCLFSHGIRAPKLLKITNFRKLSTSSPSLLFKPLEKFLSCWLFNLFKRKKTATMACPVTSQGLSFPFFSKKRSLGEKRFWRCLASNTPNQVCTSHFHVLSKMKSPTVFQKVAPGNQEERMGLSNEWFKGKAHTRKWSGIENPNSKSVKFK
ncbi:hypothetical protein YC2023_079082 [Brassica napus]